MYVINSCTRSLSLSISLAFNSVARLPPTNYVVCLLVTLLVWFLLEWKEVRVPRVILGHAVHNVK